VRWFILGVISIVLLPVLLSCSNTAGSSSSNTENIDIAGSWSISNIDLNTGTSPGTNGITFVISNTTYYSLYLPFFAVAEGTIPKFNNSQDYMIIHVTRDDLYSAPYYEKMGWQLTSSTSMILTGYEVTNSQAAAEASTNIIWGPTDPVIKQ
jgi:hypothetical protein